ncbi:Calcineurin-like phosphoesterase [Amycolatopsis xylanica]|uniref:Calcineurin-like phosphoesterase n=1 Tax=Amycolatopsis xylanica TaxID=589385 RepID=A0A1H3GNT5_9PSEU|nr:metallophosphoesterase [Amycolatopsis xylanica]SDY04635.1 Calcineurin-like phosphoesterase [Amycolatopsis xylanica]
MTTFLRRRWRHPVVYGAAATLAAGALLVAAQPPAGGAAPEVPEVPQIAEPGVTSTAISPAMAAGDVCAPGAQWLRLRFTALSLRGSDSITLTGSRAGSFTLTAVNWPGKAFHTRAFEGDCVRVTPHLADPASTYSVDSYQSGTRSLAAATSVVAGVGDVCGSSCNQTASVVKNMSPQALILAGDNAYESGSASDYKNGYDPNYGQFKSIVHPAPGNHEYKTSNASGYFDYFGSAAGERSKGYYSFDVGDWHFVALNSNITRTASSAQVTWLKNDLAASTKPCTAAYWHHPRFSKGDHGDDTSVSPFFEALYNAKADLVVVGHDHNYQRFAPSKPNGARDDANGVRELLIGTGGRGFYDYDKSSAGTQEAGNASTFGVAKLTLTATNYRHDFVPVAGRTYTDTVSGKCHKASTGTAAFSDDFETDKGWQTATSDTATTGKWERGDPEETKEADGSIKQLGTTMSGVNCLVTGRLAGASDGANDVDGGVTTMTSPQFSVPANGKLTFSYTYAHGSNSSTSDYFRVRVLDGTTSVPVFERLGTASTKLAGAWQTATADLTQFAGHTVKLVVESADLGDPSLWESAVDDVNVTG